MNYIYLKYCNKQKLKERGDYGIRVARPGFDANTCADNQLIFNSGWPILQLVEVVDMGDNAEQERRYLLPNGSWGSTLPSGYTYDSTNHDPVGLTRFSVNRKYIRYFAGVNTYYNRDYVAVQEYIYRRKKHHQPYIPFFFDMERLSGVASKKIALFSIDLTTDVDYPYTEGDLPLVAELGDYGIKSSSIFGDRVPGLCSGQFSKLVQAVKTQETAVFDLATVHPPYPAYGDPGGQGKLPFWSPLARNYTKDLNSSPLSPFEAYAFVDEGTMAIDANYNARWAYDDNTDGGPYYQLYGTSELNNTPLGNSTMVSGEPYVYTMYGGAAAAIKKASLVILRSPMVSPDYKEVIV